MDEWRDPLDEALDDALAAYGKPPENDGLERRVLARVTEEGKRMHPTKALMFAFGAAALVLSVCLVLWVTPRMAVENPPASTMMLASKKIKAPRTPTIRASASAAALASADKPRRIRKNTAEPKLSQFPAPSPPTREERALLQLATYAKDNPREFTNLGRPVKPIYIAGIEIRPIGLGWNRKEKECCDQW